MAAIRSSNFEESNGNPKIFALTKPIESLQKSNKEP